MQNEFVNGGKHENEVLLIHAYAYGFSRLRGRTNPGHDDNHHAGGDHDGASAGSRSYPCAAATSCGSPDRGTWARILLDERLLAMDWNNLRVGTRQLGSPPKTSRPLGGRALGASLRRICMGPGALAVAKETVIVTSLESLRKSAAPRLSRQIRSRTAGCRR